MNYLTTVRLITSATNKYIKPRNPFDLSRTNMILVFTGLKKGMKALRLGLTKQCLEQYNGTVYFKSIEGKGN